MSLTIKGKIVNILKVESGTSKAGKDWSKQSFVIDTGDEYNPNIAFGMFGEDKIAELAKYSVGQDVEVSFNLSSREFKDKWYTQADAWKIQVNGATEAPAQEPNTVGDLNDLPF